MAEQDAPLAPGLYLVATPIGNLNDITLRALDVLRRADRICCEDTRQTQKLLNHFQIATPTESLHEHNERERSASLVASLQAGARVAIIPIPGANAALSALVASGLPTTEFQFLGFLPEKAGQRRSRLEDLAS